MDLIEVENRLGILRSENRFAEVESTVLFHSGLYMIQLNISKAALGILHTKQNFRVLNSVSVTPRLLTKKGAPFIINLYLILHEHFHTDNSCVFPRLINPQLRKELIGSN